MSRQCKSESVLHICHDDKLFRRVATSMPSIPTCCQPKPVPDLRCRHFSEETMARTGHLLRPTHVARRLAGAADPAGRVRQPASRHGRAAAQSRRSRNGLHRLTAAASRRLPRALLPLAGADAADCVARRCRWSRRCLIPRRLIGMGWRHWFKYHGMGRPSAWCGERSMDGSVAIR